MLALFALLLAAVNTVVLFVLHALPFNTKYIEQNIVDHPTNKMWWLAAVSYYFAGFAFSTFFVCYMFAGLSQMGGQSIGLVKI